MPLYEYTCQDCGAHFDALRPMQDADNVITCKKCLGTNTRRTLSVFFASSGGKPVTSGNGCGSCAGGSCSTCGYH